jgi:DtxR family Mn-dependent transcriptional regulator
MKSREIDETRIEEILELLWTMREKGTVLLEDIIKASDEECPEDILEEIEKKGLIVVREGRVRLVDEGEKKAEEIVRRHRLAEVLLSEVFELEEKYAHSEACKFEHILSPEVTDSVCTFLGHPPACPHGNPIPRGNCCSKFEREVKPLVVPLRELSPGDEGRIVFIVPKDHTRLDKLGTLGVTPGSIIKLHQKRPSYVIKIGETELAVEDDIAKDIYVKKIEGQK